MITYLHSSKERNGNNLLNVNHDANPLSNKKNSKFPYVNKICDEIFFFFFITRDMLVPISGTLV